jgi:hypothetical protein
VTVDGEDSSALRPHVTGGSFLNFLKDPARTHAAYTSAHYERLQELKRAYDPENVFGVGHTIIPSARRSLAA